MKQSSTISANSTNTQSVNLNLYDGSSTNTNLSMSDKTHSNCNNILIEDVSHSSFHLVLLPLSQSSEYTTEKSIIENPYDNTSTNQNQINTNNNNNLVQRGSTNGSDSSYTYLYQSIDSESLKKLQDQNILNKELVTPEYLSRNAQNRNLRQPIQNESDYTYIYESLSDAPGFKNNNQSEYTYIYSYGGYDNDQLTSEYTYTYDEPSAGQINFYENQQSNALNKALKTRNILLDKNLNNQQNTLINTNLQSPNFSISNQPPIFIQRTPKKISNNKIQQRQITQKQTQNPKTLSPHKRSVLRKINLLEQELKYLDSSEAIDNDFTSMEFTESEAKEDPKIKLLQQKLAKITGKNVRNPNDHYSPENNQYTYTYAYDDTYENEDESVNKYRSKQKLNSKSKYKPKTNSRSKSLTKSKSKKSNQNQHKKSLDPSSAKERNINFPTPKSANENLPSPKSPNLILQTLNDKAISIENMNNSNQAQDHKNKVDLQISSSIQSERVIKPNNAQLSNSATLESNHDNDNSKIPMKERSIELNNEKHGKTIKKIYRRIKVDKPNNSKKNEKDFNINPAIYQSSPKKVKSLLEISDVDTLNDSEFAALNPVDARKATSSHKIDKKDILKTAERNDIVKIKIVEDANVPNVDRFCVFYIEGDEDSVKRTKTVSKGQNSYGEQFDYSLNELYLSKLVIFLKKQDLLKEDKIMGTAKIDLRKVPQNSTLSKWITLKSESGVKIESKIHLVLKRETKITNEDQVFENLTKRDINIDNNEKVQSHHRSRRRHHNEHSKRNSEKYVENQTKNEDFNKNPEQIEVDSENQISNHDSSEMKTKDAPNFEVEKIEAEAQVNLLSESSDTSENDNEIDEEEEEEEEEKSENMNHRKERKLPILDEYSNTSSHEEKSHETSLEESSYKSNDEKEYGNSNLEEVSSELEEEEEEEEEKPNLSENEDYSSHPSNKENKSYNPNLEADSYSSNQNKRSQNSILEESSHSSHKDRISQNSNFEESLHSSDIAEDRSHKSRNSQKSNKSQFDDENVQTKHVKVIRSSNEDQNDTNKSNIIEDSATSILQSFMSSTDSLKSDKYRAVELENNFHSTDTFNSSISESFKQSEDDKNDKNSNQSPNNSSSSNVPIKKVPTILKVESESESLHDANELSTSHLYSVELSDEKEQNPTLSSCSDLSSVHSDPIPEDDAVLNRNDKNYLYLLNKIDEQGTGKGRKTKSRGLSNFDQNDESGDLLSNDSSNLISDIPELNVMKSIEKVQHTSNYKFESNTSLSENNKNRKSKKKKITKRNIIFDNEDESPSLSLSEPQNPMQIDFGQNQSGNSRNRNRSASRNSNTDESEDQNSPSNRTESENENRSESGSGNGNGSNRRRKSRSVSKNNRKDKKVRNSIKNRSITIKKENESETISENDSESERFYTLSNSNSNVNSIVSDSSSFNDLVINQPLFKEKKHNFNSSFSGYKDNSSFNSSISESKGNDDDYDDDNDNNDNNNYNGDDDDDDDKSNSSSNRNKTANVINNNESISELAANKPLFKERSHNFNSSFYDNRSNNNNNNNNIIINNNSSLNDIVLKQPLFEEKDHNFNSSISEYKEQNKRSSNKPKKIGSSSASPRRIKTKNTPNDSNIKLSSLHNSDDFSSPENDEDLKEAIMSQNAKTPRNMPDTQDLSYSDEPYNMNNSGLVNNPRLSDDSLGSSSSKRRKSTRKYSNYE